MPNKYLDSVGLAEYTSLIKGELAPKASPVFTGTPTAPTPTAGDDSTKLATTEYVQEEIRTHANMPIGHEYFTMNPNIPQGSLPLFGGEYSRETYADLWAWVQQQTGYFITDSAWQAMANSQNGNVPFYSDGDGSTTFRVPSLKCWVKAANGTVTEVGSYKAAGLPNITGSFGIVKRTGPSDMIYDKRGAFSANATTSDSSNMVQQSTAGSAPSQAIGIDASRSSSIYGKSSTVQPESIVGMWLVKAYGTIEDTGVIDEQQYIDDRFAAAKDYTDSEVETGVPTGCVQAFAGQTTPTGWLLCDGSAISRVTYAKLFSVIGTSYGSGNGSTTFNVPNLVDKFVEGSATAGTVKTAGLPNITGKMGPFLNNVISGGGGYTQGVFTMSATGSIMDDASRPNPPQKLYGFNFDASRSSSIYGNSATVQPPALTMRYIIKY